MTQDPRPIVVGYDGSADGGLALRWGLETAQQIKAPVRVVVASFVGHRLPPAVRAHEEHLAHRAASAAREMVQGVPAVTADVRVEGGWTLPVLLHAAEGAAMVVVGSRGHNRYDGGWIGSVSQHLAGRAPCPVAVIRRAHHVHAREIVVGVDGSPASVRALRFAAERASLTGEAVVAVHAYHYPIFALDGALGAGTSDLDSTLAEAAERLAAELIGGLAVDFPDLDIRSTAAVGRAARVLTRYSDDASLVVVGSRGRTPVREIVLGSVAHETLHRAACSVVVVR